MAFKVTLIPKQHRSDADADSFFCSTKDSVLFDVLRKACDMKEALHGEEMINCWSKTSGPVDMVMV